MLYKIINSALFLNGKLNPEGSTIELSKEEIIGIEAYLEPMEEEATITNTKKKTNIKKEK